MTEPTNAEVMRRLDEVSRQLLSLAAEMRDDRRAAADTYVRKDVFRPMHENTSNRLTALEKDQDEKERAQDAFRRQMVIAITGVALPALFGLVVALNTLLANGGVTP